MNKKLFLIAPVLIICAGAYYKFVASPATATAHAQIEAATSPAPAGVAGGVANANASSVAAGKKAVIGEASSVPYDPRLANLTVTTDNPTIDYVRGEEGLVLAEIDNDPNNISYKKPLKEYQYYQSKVRSMTRYEYYKTEIVVTTIDVAYKPDGSVLDYREQTTTRKLGAKE